MAAHLNIVVVEDNDDLRQAIIEVLTSLGHRVLGLTCAEELGDKGSQATIDLLVVDLNLPGEDGVSLARRLRSTQPGLGILMMTARDTVRDKVSGYEAGADIYLTKPVSVEELSAAVQSLDRRLKALQAAPDSQSVLSVQVAALTAQGPAGSIELSTVEMELLSTLARAPDQRLAHWQLLKILSSDSDGASPANLAVRMTRLRKKLSDIGFDGSTLQVIRNKGYQLRLPVELQ
ncbi:MAG: response regulator transcription factor [Polaromonas sp.]|nr:response regulator transcription factor [Polaromonas sp.]